MKENTFTHTVRSATDPNKMATFTLHNGSVSVELGNVLEEQVEEAYEEHRDEASDKDISTWIKPAATGALQKLIQPIPLSDFDAKLSDDSLQATAWIRAGGLRLAPVMMTWQEVDNPAGAKAFVSTMQQRKKAIQDGRTRPNPMDYWVSWIVLVLATIVIPILFIKQWQKRRAE